MIGKRMAETLGVIAFLSVTAMSPVSAWEKAINGRPTSDRDDAMSVAVDSQTGDVFVAGQRQATSTDAVFVVMKFNAAGTQQWQHVVRGTEGEGGGNATRLAVDSNGFVFVVGWVIKEGAASTLLIKLDGRSPGKRVVFSRWIDAFGLPLDVHAMRPTSDGGVALGGSARAEGGLTSFYLMKFTPDGQDAWPTPRVLAGSAPSAVNSVSAVDILPNGDLAVVGSLANTGSNLDAVVARFDGSTGEPRWLLSFNDPDMNGTDVGSAVSIAPNGDIVGAGAVFMRNGFQNFAVFRLSEAGTLLWLRIIDGGFSDAARTVVVGPDGNVVAGGRLATSSGPDSGIFFVVGLRGTDGAERWRHEESSAVAFVEARDIVLDAKSNPVVTGLGPSVTALSSFTVLALDRDTGSVLWHAPITGNAPMVNEGRAIVADPARNAVVAAGVTQNARKSFDLTVSHFTDGREDWRQVITGRGKRLDRQDAALALAVDPLTGNLAIAGSTQNNGAGLLGTPNDFTLVRIRNSGVLARRYDFVDPLPHTENAALAVAISPNGTMFGAGRTCDIAVTSCFTVVAVGKNGNEVWRATVPGAQGQDEARAITIDPQDGNIIAAGTVHTQAGSTFAVVKLDSRTGVSIWSTPGLVGGAHALVLTSRGTVAVAGHLSGTFAVVEIETATGVPVSTGMRPGFGPARGVAFDARQGTVVASGSARMGLLESVAAVAKFDSAGTVLWSTIIGNPVDGIVEGGVAVHEETGAIAVAGLAPAVTLLDSDGLQLWHTAAEAGSAAAVSFAGNMVVAAGQLRREPGQPGFSVAAYAVDGAELWRRTFSGTASFASDGAPPLRSITPEAVSTQLAPSTTIRRPPTCLPSA